MSFLRPLMYELSRLIFFAAVSFLATISILLLLPSDLHQRTFVQLYDTFITNESVKYWYVSGFHPRFISCYNAVVNAVVSFSHTILCAAVSVVASFITLPTVPFKAWMDESSCASSSFAASNIPYYQHRTGHYTSLEHQVQNSVDFSYLEVWLRLPRVLGDNAMPYVRYSERLLGLLFLSSTLSTTLMVLFVASQGGVNRRRNSVMNGGGGVVAGLIPWFAVAGHVCLLLLAVEMAVDRNLELPEDTQHKLPGVHEATESLRMPLYGLLCVVFGGAMASVLAR